MKEELKNSNIWDNMDNSDMSPAECLEILVKYSSPVGAIRMPTFEEWEATIFDKEEQKERGLI